jgi:hypothetical protein
MFGPFKSVSTVNIIQKVKNEDLFCNQGVDIVAEIETCRFPGWIPVRGSLRSFLVAFFADLIILFYSHLNLNGIKNVCFHRTRYMVASESIR